MAETDRAIMEAVGRFETDSHPRQKDHLSPASGTSQECNDCEDEQEVICI
jgi:hypothetical protein